MKKLKQLQIIKKLYANGENIIQYLRSIENRKSNTIEDILISYDFQSGSYIKDFLKNPAHKNSYCDSLAKTIMDLGHFTSILEVGVGEATTLKPLLTKFKQTPANVLGFDISWSRIKFAKEFLSDLNIKNLKLFTANLFEIPLLDNSVDIVYTSHSIEPNGGKEQAALQELFRITNKYLILLEPSYEFAGEEARSRMIQHGYITNLFATIKKLNYKVIEHRLFEHSVNPLNPTGLIIIEKNSRDSNQIELVCPVSLTELQGTNENFLFSKESLLVYPILNNIPCLLKDNSILAAHYLTDYKSFVNE